jgi:hypothetical protein
MIHNHALMILFWINLWHKKGYKPKKEGQIMTFRKVTELRYLENESNGKYNK